MCEGRETDTRTVRTRITIGSFGVCSPLRRHRRKRNRRHLVDKMETVEGREQGGGSERLCRSAGAWGTNEWDPDPLVDLLSTA